MRTRWLLASIWICFLARGWFYASVLPLWEGYDEFAHFGVVRAMAVRGILLPPRHQKGPRDVEESLRLAPVPWEVRGWPVFRASRTEESYWSLPPDERNRLQQQLRALPAEWAHEDSTGGISAYEALQPPLYYWFMAPLLWMLRNAGLLAQVMALRWAGVTIASLAVPLTFAVARELAPGDSFALACAAVVAAMPQFAINAARVSNEPLAILLFTLLVWIGLRIVTRPAGMRSFLALGTVLGLGLLTKAYFLTAVPVVLGLLLYKRKIAWTAVAPTAAIAGWWYIRNLATTGTLSALAESVTLRDRGAGALLGAVPHIPWLHAIDVILVSHLYFCGWSSLGVRSWMYHVFFAIAAIAAVALIPRLRPAPALWLAGIYAFFWIGQLYNVVLQYLTKGLAGSMGWYLYAVVACEVILCAVAFGRWRVWAAAVGTALFAILDLYGMHWLAVPYYTGMIGHRASGALAAFHVSDLRAIGLGAAFERLAANKCAALSQPVLVALWVFYLCATVALIVLTIALTEQANPKHLRFGATSSN